MAIEDKKLVEIYLKRIKDSEKIAECNKKDIVKYYNMRFSNGITYGSNRYVLYISWRLGEHLGKKLFRDATADDLMEFFCNFKPVMNNGGGIEAYSPRTMWTFKATVKTYWRWLFGIGKKSRECPKAVDWIERNGKLLKSNVPKDVLTKEEVNEMIKAVPHPRDKAIISVLFDTGMRCGELLNMRRSQIKCYDDYIEFEANGKTGNRDCIAVESIPYLKKYLLWLEENKSLIKKGFEDSVWLNVNKSGWIRNYGSKLRDAVKERGTQISRDGIGAVVKRAANKAGIKKRVWTHLMRHSSATYWAQFMNESEMRIKFGWSKESTMPSVYINLDYSKVKEKQLKKAGKWKEPDTNEKEMFKVRECPFCSVENPVGAEFCFKCGKPVTVNKIKEAEKESNALQTTQSIISELKRLEEKGFNLQVFNNFMEEWAKNKPELRGQ